METIENSIEVTFGEKLEGAEYINRKAVYGIARNNEGKITTINTPAGYFLPGGGIESDESHHQCLEREFLEETGYEIAVEEYIGCSSLYHLTKTNRFIHGIGFFYFVNLLSETSFKTEEDHLLVWLEPTDCIKSLFLEHQVWAVTKALST